MCGLCSIPDVRRRNERSPKNHCFPVKSQGDFGTSEPLTDHKHTRLPCRNISSLPLTLTLLNRKIQAWCRDKSHSFHWCEAAAALITLSERGHKGEVVTGVSRKSFRRSSVLLTSGLDLEDIQWYHPLTKPPSH